MSFHTTVSTGSSSAFWKDAVANFAALPTGVTIGELRLALDSLIIYEWSGSAWIAATQTPLGYTAENVANKSTSTSLGTSNTLYPSQNAVKSYVDSGLSTKQPTGSYEVTSNKGQANGYAGLDANSLVPLANIPPAAIERLVIVANATARHALTTATVQNGDTVQQTDTGEMWYVYDDTQLNVDAGYRVYTAHTASAVAWSGVTTPPTTIAGYGITDTVSQALTGYSSASGTVAATDSIVQAISKLDGNKERKQNVFNGIEDATKFAVTYSAANRQFTITYNSGAAITVNGLRYTFAPGSVTTTAHANTNGIWYCYYNSSGVLTVSSAAWDLLTTAPLVSAYYTSTGPDAILHYEMHSGSTGMDNATHSYLHRTVGSKLLSGCVASGYTLNANGLANTSYALSGGSVADEDLQIAITAQLQGGANTYRIFYLAGTTAAPRWAWVDQAEGGIYSNGTNIYWNQATGGNWTLAPQSTNGFVNYYVIATSAYNAPQFKIIMGQNSYTSSALAQAATFATDVSNLQLMTDEAVILYQMTYQRGAFGAPGNIRLIAATKLSVSLSTISIGSGTVTSVGLVDISGIYSISGSPVTTAGNIAITLASQSANTVLAAPDGSAGSPTMRALVSADIPILFPVSAKSSAFTAANRNIYLVSPGAALNIQLPAPAANTRFTVKDANGTSATNNITLVRAGSEKIETVAANYVLASNLGAWEIVSDGQDWFVL